jgi:pilus assembly protein CpaB
MALVAAALAAYLAFNVVRDRSPVVVQASEAPTAHVVVAAHDMDVGHTLTADDIRLAEWPSTMLPEGYSSTPAEVVGRGVLQPIKLNEPLLSGKLALKEAGGGLPIIIPAGMRAMSVKVDQVIGVAGFTLPGTRVDVLVTLDQIAGVPDAMTQIVLQNVIVLTAGQVIERAGDGEPVTVPVVTLLVGPEEAEKLTMATSKGRIQLALRNTLDLDTVNTPGVRPSGLLRQQQVVRSGPSVPAAISVEIYRGPERAVQSVDRPSEGS